jgi:predicted TIM-barrel fold metal-dependent hydrolase
MADGMVGHGNAFGRRRFVQGAVGAAAAGVAGSLTMSAAAGAHVSHGRPRGGHGLPPKIDVHAHYLPPGYREALIAHGQSQPDGFPVLPTWSPEAHLAMLDQLGIQTAILSVTSPGVDFGADAVALARDVNEAGAAAVRAHPGRFGLFASLPLPDADSSLAELRYALDTLHADGVALLTNYQGIYLGDARFEPVLAELNRRLAVAFVHPTSPACWLATSLGYPRPLLEFLLDTTRAISDLVLNGSLQKFPDIRFIVSHSGAALPVVADRLAALAGAFPLGGQDAGEIDVVGTLQQLYYEVGAGAPFPRHVAALLDLVDASRLLFGTDFPFAAIPAIEANVAALAATDLFDDRERDAVLRGNALKLFPRLRR